MAKTVRDLSYGRPGVERTYCTTHTYFGNGVEPNNWPCRPETRQPVNAVPTVGTCADCGESYDDPVTHTCDWEPPATPPAARTGDDARCPQWNRDEHGNCLDHPPVNTHVVDRNGHVWLLVHDGGMATRATATGPISAGIAWLEETAGPLLPFDPIAYRRNYPRSAS